MKKATKQGRPPKDKTKGEYLEVRLDAEEKQAFKEAADLLGLPLSTWVRMNLRQIAKKLLEDAGRKVPFMEAGDKV